MGLTARLNPPQIGNTVPAFFGSNIRVPFIMNRAVSITQVSTLAIIVKTVSTNREVEMKRKFADSYYYNDDQHCYIALFNTEGYEFTPGQYYKIQIACVDHAGEIGYYSSVGVIKCTTEPRVEIKDRGTLNNTYEYTGLYSQKNGDITEKVYSYRFDLYDNMNTLIASSGDQLHNSSTDITSDESVDTWTIRKKLEPNLKYYIEYTITTLNGLTKSSGQQEIVEVSFEPPHINAELSAVSKPEDGYIDVKLIGNNSNRNAHGDYILLRSSSEDNFDSWYELTRFQLQNWSPKSTEPLCKDHTVSQGFSYRYAIQAYNSAGTYSNRMLNREGVVPCDFEDAFLWDGKRQLKIRFNPKVSSFKSTVLESKTDTIGGKYPFIFRNGNVEYKEFQISGLLSLLSDENNLFLEKEKDDENGRAASRLSTPAGWVDVKDAGQWLTADNYRKERQFKLEVLAWLTNGQPKLFRSAAEGNYIVRLMNVSLTPNDTLGRMLHTFNCTAYEIADYNFENLQLYGFTVPSYIETRTMMQVGQIDLSKEIPSNMRGTSANVVKLPSAYMASITDAIGLTMKATYANGATTDISVEGTYIFPQEVLRANPLVSLSSENWGSAKLAYAYYDTSLDSFSFIHKITTSDKIIQILGENNVNFINRLEDIRRKVGAFHYMRVQPRTQVEIYKIDGGYYKNHSKDSVGDLNPSTIYLVVDTGNNNKIVEYFDGRYGNIPKGNLPKDISELSFRFRISGSDAIDFDLSKNDPRTSARYEALTNISSLDELYIGDGVILDAVYQENELLYAVEVADSECPDNTAIAYRNAWLSARKRYEDAAVSGSENVEQLKEQMDKAYDSYIFWLTVAIDKLKEEYNADFAI